MQHDSSPYRDGDVFIDVWNVAGYVARVRALPGTSGTLGTFTTEYAANAEELREAAEAAVYAGGGALNVSGWYPCPPELAARAVWPLTEAEHVEARRRLAALSEGERDAWTHDQRAALDQILDRIAHVHAGRVDPEKDSWARLVLDTLPDWHSPACRAGHHQDCQSGRCTCDCGHAVRDYHSGQEGPETEDISAARSEMESDVTYHWHPGGGPEVPIEGPETEPATEPESDMITADMLLSLVHLLRTVTTRHEALLDAVRMLPSSTQRDDMLFLLSNVGGHLDTLIDHTEAAVSGSSEGAEGADHAL